MNAEWQQVQVEALCEMFYELHAAHHDKPQVPKPSDRDVEVFAGMLEAHGCSPGEAKHVLGFVFFTDPSLRWASGLDGRVQSFVNGFAQMRRAAFKHIGRSGTPSAPTAAHAGKPSVGLANHVRTPQQHEQAAAIAEANERPSDDNRGIYRTTEPTDITGFEYLQQQRQQEGI